MTFPKIAIGFAVSVAAFSLIYLLLFFLDDSAFGSQRFVGIGRYKNPIHMAFLLSVAVLMLVSMSDWSNKALQVLRYFLIFFLLIFIALTETRSAFVALAGCIMVLPLIGRWKIAAGLFGGACLAAFLAFLVWDFSANDVFSRLDNYRFGLWGNALQDALERPVFGYGIAIEPKFFPNKLVPEGLKSAHNALIGHFYTGGIIGLALYMAMVANMVWQGWVAYVRAKDNGGDAYSLPLLALLLTCFMFCASFFNFTHYMLHLHIQWLVFWVPFAICWHLEMENRKAVISSNLSSQGV